MKGITMPLKHLPMSAALVVLLCCTWLSAQEKEVQFKVPDDITFRTADIRSEGTRIAAEIFAPKSPKTEKLPTIIMAHGWGGIAQHLRPDGIVFAKAVGHDNGR